MRLVFYMTLQQTPFSLSTANNSSPGRVIYPKTYAFISQVLFQHAIFMWDTTLRLYFVHFILGYKYLYSLSLFKYSFGPESELWEKAHVLNDNIHQTQLNFW